VVALSAGIKKNMSNSGKSKNLCVIDALQAAKAGLSWLIVWWVGMPGQCVAGIQQPAKATQKTTCFLGQALSRCPISCLLSQ
jgi:hypothetical protein